MSHQGTVILIVDDLLFLPRLESTLRQLNYTPRQAVDEVELTRAIGAAPVLTIIDLFSHHFDWAELVGLIKGRQRKANHVPVVGFGPHVDIELRERALKAGCDAVVGRGAIANQLPQLIEKHKWVVNEERCLDHPPALLVEGITLFNDGEFFDCHEVIEHAWNDEADPVRVMYQGILQIGVACYHIQHKNWRGAMKLIERGLPKVQRFTPVCMGIDLAQLVTDTENLRSTLADLGPEWHGEFNPDIFPTIRTI